MQQEQLFYMEGANEFTVTVQLSQVASDNEISTVVIFAFPTYDSSLFHGQFLLLRL